MRIFQFLAAVTTFKVFSCLLSLQKPEILVLDPLPHTNFAMGNGVARSSHQTQHGPQDVDIFSLSQALDRREVYTLLFCWKQIIYGTSHKYLTLKMMYGDDFPYPTGFSWYLTVLFDYLKDMTPVCHLFNYKQHLVYWPLFDTGFRNQRAKVEGGGGVGPAHDVYFLLPLSGSFLCGLGSAHMFDSRRSRKDL